MKTLLLKLEPVVWLLFGMGIMLGTILLPGWLLVMGLGAPLGLVPESAVSFDRMHALAANPLGRLVLLGLIALPLWKGAHHLRSLSVDGGGHQRDALVGGLLYALALLGSVLGIVAVARL